MCESVCVYGMFVCKLYIIKILDAISHFAVTLERDFDLNFHFVFSFMEYFSLFVVDFSCSFLFVCVWHLLLNMVRLIRV